MAALLLAGALLLSGEGQRLAVPPVRVDEDGWLLPDLVVSPAAHLWVEVRDDEKGNRRLLHFATTVWNYGSGPLELVGDVPDDPAVSRVRAWQRVTRRGGATMDLRVGDFVYHPAHQHWHLNTFARYDLYALADGRPPRLVRTSGKVTFCILSSDRAPTTPVYPVDQEGCGLRRQVLEPGWGDTYGSYTPGQDIDVTSLPDGEYELRTTADPEGALRELDEDDNVSVTRLLLTGPSVRPLME